jgi:DNA-directed RNA polymerase specialized sigma24 family protein
MTLSADRAMLTPDAFERFLGRLGPDPAAAATEYVRMRDKLASFFAGRGSPSPEDDADRTLDRMARKLDEGARVDHVRAYAYGVARHVLMESARNERRRHAALQWLPLRWAPDAEALLWEMRARCLAHCLDDLPAESRRLLLDYHLGCEGSVFERRRRLADQLGVAPGALRTRVHRIRARLQRRMTALLEAPPPS